MFFIVYNFTCPSFLYSSINSMVSSQKSVLPTYTWWRCSSVMISIFFIFSSVFKVIRVRIVILKDTFESLDFIICQPDVSVFD